MLGFSQFQTILRKPNFLVVIEEMNAMKKQMVMAALALTLTATAQADEEKSLTMFTLGMESYGFWKEYA